MLELITHRPVGDPHPNPLLFLHGSNSGAWIWAEHFLPFFAQNGFTAHALSLRGHGNSSGAEGLMWASLADYVEDLSQTVAGLEGPPILIGHSMGGMVVQRYLQHQTAAATVLMASAPPMGLGAVAVSMALQDPLLYTQTFWVQSLGLWFPTAFETVRKLMFTERTPPELLARYFPRLQDESHRVIFDLMWPMWAPPPRGRSGPVMVLGGADDAMVAPWLVHTTAAAFGVTAEIIPEAGHAMMLDANWQTAAERILDWVKRV